MYGGLTAGDTGSGTNMNTITLLGPPPASTTKRLLVVCFSDEAENGNNGQNPVAPSLYHSSGGVTTTPWPNATDGTGVNPDGTDSEVGFTWKGDYNAFVNAYLNWTSQSADHQANFFMYPSAPPTVFLPHRPFPLHVLGAISSGNQTVVDGTFLQGTAPYCSVAMGGANGIGRKMCNIENYGGHVRVNPYYTPIAPNILPPFSAGTPSAYGYGGLDNYGWGTNVAEATFTQETFTTDIEVFWEAEGWECDDSECWYITVVNQNGVAVEDYDIILDGAKLGTTDEYGRFHIVIPNASLDTQHILNLCWCLTSEGDCRQQKIKITVTEECPAVCCDDIFDACPPAVIIPEEPILMGCTDPLASNYSSLANVDDGSCMYCGSFIVTEVHTDADLGIDNGTITITATGGILPYTYGWNSSWGGFVDPGNVSSATGLGPGVYTIIVMDSEGCTEVITIFISQPLSRFGCMDVCACNYDATANIDDGSCLYAGCIDLTGVNTTYAICADTGLEMIVPPQAPTADCLCVVGGTNYSCCDYCIYGCQDVNAVNYDGAATCDCDGTYMGCTTTSNPACIGPGAGECCEYYWVCEEGAVDSCDTLIDPEPTYAFDIGATDFMWSYYTTFVNNLTTTDWHQYKYCYGRGSHGGAIPSDACECNGRDHWNATSAHVDSKGYILSCECIEFQLLNTTTSAVVYDSSTLPLLVGGDKTWQEVVAGIQDVLDTNGYTIILDYTTMNAQDVKNIVDPGTPWSLGGSAGCACECTTGGSSDSCDILTDIDANESFKLYHDAVNYIAEFMPNTPMSSFKYCSNFNAHYSNPWVNWDLELACECNGRNHYGATVAHTDSTDCFFIDLSNYRLMLSELAGPTIVWTSTVGDTWQQVVAGLQNYLNAFAGWPIVLDYATQNWSDVQAAVSYDTEGEYAIGNQAVVPCDCIGSGTCNCVEDPLKTSGGPYHVDEAACDADASNCCGECGCMDNEDYTGGSLFALHPDINGCDADGNCGRTGPGGAGPYCTSDGLLYDCANPTNTPTGYVRCNYNPAAQCDDGSCYTCGCMIQTDPCYNNLATVDDNSCEKWKCEPGTFNGTNTCTGKTQMFWDNNMATPVMWDTTVQSTGPPYCGGAPPNPNPNMGVAAEHCAAEWFFDTGNGDLTFNQYFYLDNIVTSSNSCWDPTYPSYAQHFILNVGVTLGIYATGLHTTANNFRTAIIGAGLSSVNMSDSLATIRQKLHDTGEQHGVGASSGGCTCNGTWTPCTCITDPAGTYIDQDACLNPTIPNCCQQSWHCNVNGWQTGNGSSSLTYSGCNPDTITQHGVSPRDWSTMDVTSNYFPNPAAIPDTWSTWADGGGLIDSTITAPVTYHTMGGPWWVQSSNIATVTGTKIIRMIADPANGLQLDQIGSNYFWSETPGLVSQNVNMQNNNCHATVAQINNMMYPNGSGLTGPAFTSATGFARKDRVTSLRVAKLGGGTYLTGPNGTWAQLINWLECK